VIPQSQEFVERLADFVHIEANLPALQKNYLTSKPIEIRTQQSRMEIIEYLQSLRTVNNTADLAFYAYRDMESCNWLPFTKAAIERNPVSIEMTQSKSIEQIYEWLKLMKNDSIYEGKRLAQPDEVANYKTGDGLEKAFLLANVLRNRVPDGEIDLIADNENVTLTAMGEFRFQSAKKLEKKLQILQDSKIVMER